MKAEFITFHNNKAYKLVASCKYDKETNTVKLTKYEKA